MSSTFTETTTGAVILYLPLTAKSCTRLKCAGPKLWAVIWSNVTPAALNVPVSTRALWEVLPYGEWIATGPGLANRIRVLTLH